MLNNKYTCFFFVAFRACLCIHLPLQKRFENKSFIQGLFGRTVVIKYERRGVPKTFLSMLRSPANMSAYSSGDTSPLISFTSIKPTFVVDIWTVNMSDFKSYEKLKKCQVQVQSRIDALQKEFMIFEIFCTWSIIPGTNLYSNCAFQSIRSCREMNLQTHIWWVRMNKNYILARKNKNLKEKMYKSYLSG